MITNSRQCKSALRRAARWLGDRRGNVATEFALILPVTVVMLLGVIEFGLAVNTGSSLENGARAGAQFALGQGLDEAGITAVVAAAADVDPATLTVASREFCECSGSWGTEVACTTDCGSGIPLAQFIEVSVNHPYTPMFSLLASMTPAEMNSLATVRVP